MVRHVIQFSQLVAWFYPGYFHHPVSIVKKRSGRQGQAVSRRPCSVSGSVGTPKVITALLRAQL